MIIVTGTKRSGTSMWMQVLAAAGIDVIGEPFPRTWGQTIREANPSGFYESPFRKGIYWATNPDPRTGAFLRPRDVERSAVKVFAPGLVRSDLAYIGSVIVTLRRCREYCASLRRLYAIEDRGIEALRGRQRPPRVRMSPELEWWTDNWIVVRDIVTRGHDARLFSYDQVARNGPEVVRSACAWLGAPHPEAAASALRPEHRTQADLPPLGVEHEGLFDEFYERIDAAEALDRAMLTRLNDLHATLLPRIRRERAAVRRDAARRKRSHGNADAPSVTDGLLRFDEEWSAEGEPGTAGHAIDLRRK